MFRHETHQYDGDLLLYPVDGAYSVVGDRYFGWIYYDGPCPTPESGEPACQAPLGLPGEAPAPDASPEDRGAEY